MELMATKQDVFKILQRIKYLPNCPMNEGNTGEIVDMFFVVLKDLSFELLEKAALFYLGQGNPFFPMPGALRQKALEMQMIALRIPTATEAWGMVLNRQTSQPGAYCSVYSDMESELKSLTNGYYLLKIKEMVRHEETCYICKPTTYEPVYGHPLVAKTVRLLGGLDAILTENPVADRARFIQAYQEILEREQSIVGMVPEVREFVQEQSLALEEERRSALDTGEKKYIERQTRMLTSRRAV
jgi:hypothetical protein